jgi:hypothetical protein
MIIIKLYEALRISDILDHKGSTSSYCYYVIVKIFSMMIVIMIIIIIIFVFFVCCRLSPKFFSFNGVLKSCR